MRSINLQSDDWKKLEKAAAEIGKYPAYWNYGFSTVEHIIKAVDDIEAQTNVPIRAIFVDYIQLMEAPGKGNRSDQIAYISRRLKALSINRQMPTLICAAAQLRRENVRAAIYDLSAWLGSGGLERDMDIGMMIHDEPDTSRPGQMLSNYKMIEIVGSRETGDAQPVHVKYNGSMGRMTDASAPPQKGDITTR
jgi:replicative DNA helicase